MKKLFTCTACGFKYKDEQKAKECFDWCTTKNSCNLEITQHAVTEEGNTKSAEPQVANTGLLATVLGGITTIFILVCPICYALPLLLALGLGGIVAPFAAFGQWFLLFLVLVSLFIFYRDSKKTKNSTALILGATATIVFAVSRFIFDSITGVYIAGALVACATAINYYQLKKACITCKI
jgi:hypothetical protein